MEPVVEVNASFNPGDRVGYDESLILARQSPLFR